MKREYPELDLKNVDDIVEYLTALDKKKSTIRTNVWCVMQYHKLNTPDLDLTRFKEVYKNLTIELNEKHMKQTKEGKEHKSLEWPKVLEAVEKINADEHISDEIKLLVALYTEIPPVRNDYMSLRICRRSPREDVGNYIVLNDTVGKIIINEHKTAKEYGALKIKLPARLRARMLAYIKENDSQTHLFNVSGPSISRWLGDAFFKHSGQRVTINTLRHSYISEFRKGDKTLLEKRDLARAMGHGLGLQELYREVD